MKKMLFLLFMFGCGGGETVFVPVAAQPNDRQPADNQGYPQDNQQPFPEPLPLPEDEGQALYLAKCSPCHGKNPDIVGANAAQIKEALRTVRPMFNVKASSAEQQKIGIFLTDLARANPGNPGGGGGDDDEGGEDD